jgi:hypothetical protein
MRLKSELELRAMFESTSARNFRKFESSAAPRAMERRALAAARSLCMLVTRAASLTRPMSNRSFTIQHTVHHAMTCSPSLANGGGKPRILAFRAPQAPAFPGTLAFV